MKNYKTLMAKIASWLRPKALMPEKEEALFFTHIFCHSNTPYHFEESDGWMAQNFFTGGTMASHDLLVRFMSVGSTFPTYRLFCCDSFTSRTTCLSFRVGTSTAATTGAPPSNGYKSKTCTAKRGSKSLKRTQKLTVYRRKTEGRHFIGMGSSCRSRHSV